MINTDGAPLLTVATALLACARSWEPEARLLGNIRAADMERLAVHCIEQLSENPGCNRCGTNDRLEGCRWCLQCEATRTADEHQDEYAEANEHPRVPRSDWEHQVDAGDTSKGYWQFVAFELAMRALGEE